MYLFLNIFLAGFERRRCETTGKWEPEAPSCKETLCKDIVAPSNGTMVLTTFGEHNLPPLGPWLRQC